MKKRKLIKCWEYFGCREVKCPAYHSKDLRCWLYSGSFCHNKAQGKWLDKIEVCIRCDVFTNNITEKDFIESLKLISSQFKDYKKRIEKEQKISQLRLKKLNEFKTTSIYLLKELNKRSNRVISEKRELEENVNRMTEEIRNIESKLIQSTKMAALGKFSAGIAHEINNPLGATINYVRMVLANPEVSGEIKGYLELALKGLFRIQYIVSQMLGYSGIQKEYCSIDINKLLKDTIVFIQHKLNEKDIQLILKLNNELPKIFANPTHLQQVFINIINNAIDAMQSNGKLIIETSSKHQIIEIKFIDNGKGIKEEDMDKIFDPFFTTKEVGEGTGLGLFICYNIIQIYSGTIEVKSKEGDGTTVIVKLPISWSMDKK